MTWRALAPAKVNLCLYLGPTRADGRHELVTVFQALDLADDLTMRTLVRGSDSIVCPGVEGENLAARALTELRARGWDGPPVEITIDKHIPIAGGMAGGSADAAATLRLAASVAPASPEELDAIAASLGADVPAQLAPGVALGTGAGEIVERSAPLAEHACVVLPLARTLATPAVFAEADRLDLPRSAGELRALEERARAGFAPGAVPPAELVVNDLQPAAVSLCPPIRDALDAATQAGAEQAIVSGSGPTVVGIWWGRDAAARASAAAEALRSTYPSAIAARPVTAPFAAPTPA